MTFRELTGRFFKETIYGLERVAFNDQSFLLRATFTLSTLRFWLFWHLVLLSGIKLILVRKTGFAPARVFFEGGLPPDCKSGASAYFATSALNTGTDNTVPALLKRWFSPANLSHKLIRFGIVIWPSPSGQLLALCVFRVDFLDYALFGQTGQHAMNGSGRIFLRVKIETHRIQIPHNFRRTSCIGDVIHCFHAGFSNPKFVKARRFAAESGQGRNRLTQSSNLALQRSRFRFDVYQPFCRNAECRSSFPERGFISGGLLWCHKESVCRCQRPCQ